MALIGWTALVLSCLYFLAAALVRWGMSRSRTGATGRTLKTRVSVVIAARDEEERLPAALASLKKQTYPTDLWDVTVVDDRSRDRTAAIVRETAQTWPQLRLVRVRECPPNLGGKQHALAVGIESTSGDLVLMTDADCILPAAWVEDMVSAFAPDVGIVAGLATFRPSRSLWVRLQQADLAHLMGAAWGFIGLGIPFSAIGNNLAVRRATYDEIGGYRALGFTVAEDCALVQRLSRTGPWKVAMAPASATVITEASRDFGAFLRQRVRWASGVRWVRWWQRGILALVLAHRFLMAISVPLFGFGLLEWTFVLGTWLAWVVGDALIIAPVARAVRVPSLRRMTPFVVVWEAIYQPVVGTVVTFSPRKVGWRDTDTE